jgi:ABC-type Zn uptake system ZnuABC Zn-binding protein ZnuA
VRSAATGSRSPASSSRTTRVEAAAGITPLAAATPAGAATFEANLTAYTAELDAAATYLTMMRHSARVIAANLR